MAIRSARAEDVENTDRRVLRSRQMPVDALARLLLRRDFDDTSIQEITDEADLTRATFYLHFADKSALLQAMTAIRFGELIEKRGISRTTDAADLKGLAQVVCEYLAKVLECHSSSNMPLERAVIPAIEGVLQKALKGVNFAPGVDADSYATAIAWALYGLASRWAHTLKQKTAEEMADAIEVLLRPIIENVLSARLS
ncbi:TetR/AcrR family transcriptional regulator [Acidipila sp. EB88]|uniref:TetR/AcrR family transcriptional regulator n=1 Tax=Acidipila sp. EB88 TaxID=2305226 RepID=UPI000F5FD963|nr:TetR/AcrR family transcriptional regulator [Acidipila sp. EB88]RRA47690.1 TetR/AcrR family transcriptional regulator [Acidipila sp. EB88]